VIAVLKKNPETGLGWGRKTRTEQPEISALDRNKDTRKNHTLTPAKGDGDQRENPAIAMLQCTCALSESKRNNRQLTRPAKRLRSQKGEGGIGNPAQLSMEKCREKIGRAKARGSLEKARRKGELLKGNVTPEEK